MYITKQYNCMFYSLRSVFELQSINIHHNLRHDVGLTLVTRIIHRSVTIMIMDVLQLMK